MSIVRFEPKTFSELEAVSKIAMKSGLMPQGMTPEKFMIIAMKGAELGLPVLQAIQGINVINNKPAISAELMLALIYKRVPTAKIVFIESTNLICTISAKRASDDQPSEFTFTMADAEAANLLSKGVWKSYPSAMLRARCISAMARAMFPDALMGASYTPEELDAEPSEDDIPEAVEVISDEQLKLITDALTESKADIPRFLSLIKVSELRLIPESRFKEIMEIIEKRNRHLKEAINAPAVG